VRAAPAGVITADAFVRESEASTNFGTRVLLEVDNSPRKRTFIRVVVSGVGGGAGDERPPPSQGGGRGRRRERLGRADPSPAELQLE
jgi:hypothetical protein